MNLIFDRQFDAALVEAEKMLERSPGHASAMTVKGDVHFYRSGWDQAEAFYRELLSPVGSEQSRLRLRFDGFRRLAGLYLARGQVGQALDCINQALHEAEALGERRWFLVFKYKRAFVLAVQGKIPETAAEIEFLFAEAERRNSVTGKLGALGIRGMMNVEMGDLGGARRIADEMKMEIEGWLNPALIRRWHHLEGHIELAEENFDGAVAHFEEAVALLPNQYEPIGDAHAWYFDALANAYYRSGELEKALEWYENILALTTGRLGAGVTYAETHFMLGQIYERRGMDAEAIRSYRTFLDLWREADLQAPEIEEAKRALAALLE